MNTINMDSINVFSLLDVKPIRRYCLNSGKFPELIGHVQGRFVVSHFLKSKKERKNVIMKW